MFSNFVSVFNPAPLSYLCFRLSRMLLFVSLSISLLPWITIYIYFYFFLLLPSSFFLLFFFLFVSGFVSLSLSLSLYVLCKTDRCTNYECSRFQAAPDLVASSMKLIRLVRSRCRHTGRAANSNGSYRAYVPTIYTRTRFCSFTKHLQRGKCPFNGERGSVPFFFLKRGDIL